MIHEIQTEKHNTVMRGAARCVLCFTALAALLLIFIIWNVNAGSVPLSVKDILKILFLREGDETACNIIWQIRLPRICTAGLLGGALAVSGFLLQTFFHNPIAGPFVLGITSGAKLFVALALIFFIGQGINLGSGGLVLAAFAGSMLSMAFVLLAAGKLRNMSMLVVCGVMVGYICSAVTDFIVTFAQDSNIVNLHNWSMGSFSSSGWEDLKWITAIVLITSAAVFLLSKPMSAYQMGEAYAENLGVNIRLFRVVLLLCSGILSACVTAFAGPVSFVGIAVPHIMKNCLKSSKPILMTPACFLGGAVFCLFSDLIARTMFAPTELAISSVTAIFGAPVVIYMMIRRQREKI